ncbi:hypothetical protein HC766_03045 [Candidatus Gracilibacteria bacterium]|nr:hypothetical protein [Candidatus Gracilibacteria bacterium]NJS41332.1 hypothetical protein [Candidatus Gracilibacteria bacterium]
MVFDLFFDEFPYVHSQNASANNNKLQRISYLNSMIIDPNKQSKMSMYPRNLLAYFVEVFENDHRGQFPVQLLKEVEQYAKANLIMAKAQSNTTLQQPKRTVSNVNLINNNTYGKYITPKIHPKKSIFGKAYQGLSSMFTQKRSKEEYEHIQRLFNILIRLVLDNITVTIDGKDVIDIYHDNRIEKLHQSVIKAVSSYANTLYDNQLDGDIIQKASPFNTNAVLFPDYSQGTGQLRYEVISLQEAIQKQLDLFEEKFKIDMDPTNETQMFLEEGQIAKVNRIVGYYSTPSLDFSGGFFIVLHQLVAYSNSNISVIDSSIVFGFGICSVYTGIVESAISLGSCL